MNPQQAGLCLIFAVKHSIVYENIRELIKFYLIKWIKYKYLIASPAIYIFCQQIMNKCTKCKYTTVFEV